MIFNLFKFKKLPAEESKPSLMQELCIKIRDTVKRLESIYPIGGEYQYLGKTFKVAMIDYYGVTFDYVDDGGVIRQYKMSEENLDSNFPTIQRATGGAEG